MDKEKDLKTYQKNYKKYHYSKTRKIITLPLLIDDYNDLKKRADKVDITVNRMVKDLTLDFLENRPHSFQTSEQKEILKEYIRISRGIATNINQLAHSSNIGQTIDTNILINSLKQYEDEFKSLLSKIM